MKSWQRDVKFNSKLFIFCL